MCPRDCTDARQPRPSSWRKPGPIPRDLSVAHAANPERPAFAKLPLGVMGPGFRQDDIGSVCARLLQHRHCEPPGPRKARPDDRLREAVQTVSLERAWIASSQGLVAMTWWESCARNGEEKAEIPSQRRRYPATSVPRAAKPPPNAAKPPPNMGFCHIPATEGRSNRFRNRLHFSGSLPILSARPHAGDLGNAHDFLATLPQSLQDHCRRAGACAADCTGDLVR
ncbi:hypothetical protein EAS61_16880 [Bradyrhizobium zhanjiangense]|uniref:Uncharacterized protein n=1 Tax=Bradyrhizobium zhanjiangense TaxID=1325107 RepID=A0A4Q0QN23_9BRAD|nr:hypothetical protein EAS61_16880 [Bradyrhizobium zhanjiangense]